MTGAPFVRVPPHDLAAEQALLGGLTLAPHRTDEVAARLHPADFYRKDHGAIYTAICELSRRGAACDAVTLNDYFAAHDVQELTGGAGYVIELANTTPGTANLMAYADIVAGHATRRQLIDQMDAISAAAYRHDDDTRELISRGIGELMALHRVDTRHEFSVGDAATLALDMARQTTGTLPGLSSGLDDLDSVLGGLHDSDLIVIGARPGMGKTALMLNMAGACDVPCGIISAEQPVIQIGARLLAMRSRVPAERLRNGSTTVEDLSRLHDAAEQIRALNIRVYDHCSPTIADIERVARGWHREFDASLILVDYIQRIESSRCDRRAPKHEKVGEVVRGLKNLARELDLPVIALSQVSREAESRLNGRPQLADLSDSSEIEKEADQVITLYRPSVYKSTEPKNLAVLTVEKNRHGRTGRIDVAWMPETMRFGNYAHGAAP